MDFGRLFAIFYFMRKGFSLIELIVVIGIVSILAMIATPNFKRLREIFIIKGAMQEIITFVNLAKSTALRNNEKIMIVFPKGMGVTVTTYLDKNHDGTKNTDEDTDIQGKPTPKLNITKDMETYFTDGSLTQTTVGIDPTGIVDGNYSILFKYSSDQYRRIDIFRAGRISAKRSSDGVNWK